MIHRIVSAALLLRDGFTGRALPTGSVLTCAEEGRRLPVIRKNGGWAILTDLAAGKHTVTLRCAGFCAETLSFETEEGKQAEPVVDLRPGRGYPYPPGTAFLKLTLAGAADTELWAGMSGAVRLSAAQAKAGETDMQLVARGPRERLPIPGRFLLADGKTPELVMLRSMDSAGAAKAEEPLQSAHARGTELIPMRRFVTDGAGEAELSFPAAGTLLLYHAGVCREAELKPGKQELDWKSGKA